MSLTNEQLDQLEDRAKHQLEGPCTGMAREVLELVAELRKARVERDWLAEHIPNAVCPEGKSECDDRTPTAGGTVGYACLLCWLKAARNAVEGP